MEQLLKLDTGTRVLHWSHDTQKVYRCVVRWYFSGGGLLLPYAECRDYSFVIHAETEGIYWLRGGWTRENVAALSAAAVMGDGDVVLPNGQTSGAL